MSARRATPALARLARGAAAAARPPPAALRAALDAPGATAAAGPAAPLQARALWGAWPSFGLSSSSSAAAAADTPPHAEDELPPPSEHAAAAPPAAEGAPDAAADAADAEAEALRALSPEELHEALLAARAEAAEERAERADMKDRLLRTLADMENLRERTARQAAEARQFAVQDLVKRLCDVADNLERAAGAVPADALAADPAAAASLDAAAPALERALGLLRGLREGVALTDSILMGVLAREGVERFDPLGAEFDPNLHNALFEVPDAARAPGTVAAVIKKGYTLHGRAVRAADVGVARAP